MPFEQTANWARVEDLLRRVLDVERYERSAFLEEACVGAPELRREVESLLRAAEDTSRFLDDTIALAARGLAASEDLTGHQIGPYRAVRLLGQGGMSMVYLAERADDEFRRRVAIKVLSGLLGQHQSMLARFRSERQILANLEHPNIAHLLDGGVTSDGSPYLVMQYVEGKPISEYCQEKRLGVEQRLRLVCKVASAIEYAHQHLVIHRDIKPGNVLVSLDGEPKLLDFGIASLLMPDSHGSVRGSVVTRCFMTLAYASPEQVRGDASTTATDVYGLGVLLYELLTGQLPFRLEGASPAEAIRAICEEEAKPPSVVSAEKAELHGWESGKISEDLDRIVLKAIRKEPHLRYASVAQFTADVQAFLGGYPITARGTHPAYRFSKFVRRNVALTLLTAASIVAMAGFSIEMSWLARKAAVEEQKTKRTADFLTSLFDAATPPVSQGHEITARDLLERGAQRIDHDLNSDPELQTSLILTVTSAYLNLGLYDHGLALLSRYSGPSGWAPDLSSLDRASILDLAGHLYRLKTQYNTAEPLFRQAFALRQAALGRSHSLTVESIINLGECLDLEDKDREAESLLRECMGVDLRGSPDLYVKVRIYLAVLLRRKGEIAQAIQLLDDAADFDRRTRGELNPDYGLVLHNLAGALIDMGDLNRAEKSFRELLPLRRQTLGNDHPHLAFELNNLGYVLLELGKWQEAEPYLREALDLRVRVLGNNDMMTAASVHNWARYLQARGDYAQAESLFRQAIAVASGLNPKSSLVAQMVSNLGWLEFDRGRYSISERYARSALAMREKLAQGDYPAQANHYLQIGLARLYQGDAHGAEDLFRKALDLRQRKFGPSQPATSAVLVRLGQALCVEQKDAEAIDVLGRAVTSLAHPPFSVPLWQVAEARGVWDACLVREGSAESPPSFRMADLAMNPRPVLRRNPRQTLAELRDRWKTFETLAKR